MKIWEWVRESRTTTALVKAGLAFAGLMLLETVFSDIVEVIVERLLCRAKELNFQHFM